jgi:6-phospho-beta-glucosidase
MKIVFVGGGSFRTLPIVRATLADGQTLQDGEIVLVDFNLARAETVGRLITHAPEFADQACRVWWTDRLEEALPGADVVSVSFPVGSHVVCRLSEQASHAHGFFASDQLSVSGAFRALTGGPILLAIARAMERHCPDAWLVDFANPVAVYSGLVNNHTRIRALGICGGFANHRWDLPRLLGRDVYDEGFDVDVAGVNHLSFILRGSYRGDDLYTLLGRHLTPGWRPPRITSNPRLVKHIPFGLQRLAELYRRFGTIIFSTEGDGMRHLFMEQTAEWEAKNFPPPVARTRAQLLREVDRAHATRRAQDAELRAFLDVPGDAVWARPHPWLAPAQGDVTVLILQALGGGAPAKIVASHTNQGAVRGFKDRTVLEYSMTLCQAGATPVPDLEVPDPYHGLISALATHQTLLGDAVATQDPHLLATALFAYPLGHNTRAARALFRALVRIHAAEIAPAFQRTPEYL